MFRVGERRSVDDIGGVVLLGAPAANTFVRGEVGGDSLVIPHLWPGGGGSGLGILLGWL